MLKSLPNLYFYFSNMCVVLHDALLFLYYFDYLDVSLWLSVSIYFGIFATIFKVFKYATSMCTDTVGMYHRLSQTLNK